MEWPVGRVWFPGLLWARAPRPPPESATGVKWGNDPDKWHKWCKNCRRAVQTIPKLFPNWRFTSDKKPHCPHLACVLNYCWVASAMPWSRTGRASCNWCLLSVRFSKQQRSSCAGDWCISFMLCFLCGPSDTGGLLEDLMFFFWIFEIQSIPPSCLNLFESPAVSRPTALQSSVNQRMLLDIKWLPC